MMLFGEVPYRYRYPMLPAPQLARRIVHSLADRPAVAGPDHPFLLLSPDVLVADETGLIAVLIQHAEEVRRPERLTARLILSNLALPARTRFVAVQRGEGIVARDFDLLIDGDASTRRISAQLRNVTPARAITPRDVYSQVLERAEEVAARPLEALERASHVEDAFTLEELPTIATVLLDPGDGRPSVRSNSGSRGTTLASRLRSAFVRSTVYDFAIDNGAVFPAADQLPVHAISVDENLMQSSTFDPFKLVRAAAFAGWAVVGTPNELSIWSDLDDFNWDQPGE